MNEGAFIGSSQSAGDEAPVEEKVPHNARDSQTEPKRGRVSSMVWELYTNEKDVHMKIACICQHCGHQIVHRKKSERAISHLLRCNPFLKEMMLLDPINRPDWFNNAKANKRKTAGARSSAGISQSSSQTGSILQYTPAKTDEKGDLAKIEEALEMHYYLTGTAFSRIEEENLLSAFRICRPDIVLPIERSWANEPIVNYMLISDSSTFFLESVSTGEQSHDAKWIAQDMGRVIDYLAGKELIQGTGKQKESQQKIHDIITDGKFVEHLDKAIMILNPVDTTIVVFQSDSVPVSQIYQSFANTMKEQYEMMGCLSGAERFYLLQLLQSILDFLYGDAIGIAYLLDPRFVGKKMTAFERTRVEDLIFDYDSETEQAQQMGKRESNVSSVHQFCDQGQSQQGSKGFSLPDVGKREPRLSCSSGWLTVLNSLN
ncbi:hypothetical protein BASA83_010356 [Batrachochytrium salamandrivorans]|nr:hypothetical protein BASA83_010356 [Batrachochytrium salamandrivorans]